MRSTNFISGWFSQKQGPLLTVIFILYAALQIYPAFKLSVNYDEGSFLHYGVNLLKGQGEKDVDLYDSKLPVTALNALPRAAEQIIHPGLKKTDATEDVKHGRLISLAASILLGLLIFRWTHERSGPWPAWMALFFYLTCPNFLAHGIFVSSDIFACLFMTSTLYFLFHFLDRKGTMDFLLFSLSFALAQISKFSMLHLGPLVVMIIVLYKFFGPSPVHATQGRSGLFRALGYIAAFLFVNWFIISASHLFYDSFFPLTNYTYKSEGFRYLVRALGDYAGLVRIPLPSSYIRSLDAVMYADQLGGGLPGSLNGSPYILGRYSADGFWYYYLITFIFKIPIPLLLVILGTKLIYMGRFSREKFIRQDIFLLIPIAYYVLYLSFLYSTQIGIRHILVIFPLIFVLSGDFFAWLQLHTYKWTVMTILMGWQLISVGLYYPHMLPYTNEFITRKINAWKWIADTNLCYGEGEVYAKEYLSKHPEVVENPAKAGNGIFLLEVNQLLGLHQGGDPHRYDWLKNLKPAGHIHSQYLIFEVDDRKNRPTPVP